MALIDFIPFQCLHILIDNVQLIPVNPEEEAAMLSGSSSSSDIIPSSYQTVEASEEIYAAASADITLVYDDVLVTQQENIINTELVETDSGSATSSLSEGDYGGVVVPDTEYEDDSQAEEELNNYVNKTLINLNASSSQDKQKTVPGKIDVISVNEISSSVQIVQNKSNRYVLYDDIPTDLSRSGRSCSQDKANNVVTNGVDGVSEENASAVEEVQETHALRRSRRNSVIKSYKKGTPDETFENGTERSQEKRSQERSKLFTEHNDLLNCKSPVEEPIKQVNGNVSEVEQIDEVPKIRRSRRNSTMKRNNVDAQPLTKNAPDTEEVEEKRTLRKSRRASVVQTNAEASPKDINGNEKLSEEPTAKRSKNISSSISTAPIEQIPENNDDNNEESEILHRMLNEELVPQTIELDGIESFIKFIDDLSEVESNSNEDGEHQTLIKPKNKHAKKKLSKKLENVILANKENDDKISGKKKTLKKKQLKNASILKENVPPESANDNAKSPLQPGKQNNVTKTSPRNLKGSSTPAAPNGQKNYIESSGESTKRSADSDSDEWTPHGIVKHKKIRSSSSTDDEDIHNDSFFSSYTRDTTIIKTRTRVVTRSNRFCDEINSNSEVEPQRRKTLSPGHNEDSDDEFLKTVIVRRNSTNGTPNRTLTPKESVIMQRHSQSTQSTSSESSISERRVSRTPKLPEEDAPPPFALVANKEDLNTSFKDNLGQTTCDDASSESEVEDNEFEAADNEPEAKDNNFDDVPDGLSQNDVVENGVAENSLSQNGVPENDLPQNGVAEYGDPQGSQASETIPVTEPSRKPYKPFPIFTSESSTCNSLSPESPQPKRLEKKNKSPVTKIPLRRKMAHSVRPKRAALKRIENKLPPDILSSLPSPDLESPKFNELIVQPYMFQEIPVSQVHIDIHRREVKAQLLADKLVKLLHTKKISEKDFYLLGIEVFTMCLKCNHNLNGLKNVILENYNKIYLSFIKKEKKTQ